uniref:Cytochrome c assembly protein n=1 Tax=uncultured Bacteroidota bacterium TaxID=152509 RepID=H5SAZ7_9BACT|nr:cytochrome c assembly protein [uncultured Bacteroidetes bacterium]
MLAQLIIHLCFGTALAVAIGYWIGTIQQKEAPTAVARTLYYVLVFLVMSASAILLVAIATHNFDFTYVQAYSSRQLGPPFLYAAFYSGQEGSFLLWMLLVSIVGIAVIEYSRSRGIEAETMAFYSLVLVFLSLMLVAKNPFAYLWETFAREGTTREFIEAIKGDPTRYEGRGLNPVLQNYWIMIHPPMLFTGFAAMTAPFAFAMAGLWRRQYHDWTRLAQPWIIAAVLVLGIGITLGGLWAYETLGWGGFWAWDPVENSSLVPWLLATALLHTTLVQRRTKGLIRTNFILAIAAFGAVLYSTFLTRSGVLGDTSVHSFVEPGYFVYVLLLVFLLSFLGLGFGLLLLRWRDVSTQTVRRGMFAVSSREFLLSIGSILLLLSAAVVLLGTSYPIVAELIGKPKAAIEPQFYNELHLPLVAAMLIVNGLSLIAVWSQTPPVRLAKGIGIAGGAGIVAAAAGLAFGIIPNMQAALAIVAAAIALIINGQHILRLLRNRKPMALGAFISHAGLAILVIGIVQWAWTSTTTHLRLAEGVPSAAFDYTFTLLGKEQLEQHLRDREKYRYIVAVEKNGVERYAYPIVYYSDFNRRQAPFLEPGIISTLGHDVYLAPKALDVEERSPTVTLTKGQVQRIPIDTSATIELRAFDMSRAQMSDIPGALMLGVNVRLRTTSATVDTTLYTYFNEQAFVPKKTVIGDLVFELIRIERNQSNPERSTATIRVGTVTSPPAPPRQVLVLDVSLKPMINLVWCGFVVLLGGVLLSTIRAFRTHHSPSKNVQAHELQPKQSSVSPHSATESHPTQSLPRR